MLENYCLTWGGAADLLVPVSGDAVVHEAIWPLIEMFDADFWATYNRTRREFMLADPAGFESWLEGKAAAWADEHESSPAQARTMFTADRILDAPVGHLQLSDELLGEIKRRTAPVLWPEADVHVGYYGADTTPGFPIIDVSELRPLPVRVQVMDTASLPSALRVLVAMKCGGLAPRQQARVRRAGVAVEQVQVGLDDLEELLMLSWRGRHVPPGVILDPTAVPTGRLAEDETNERRSYAVPSGLSLVGCDVFRRMHPGQYETPLTLVVGSTADDFAYALALDRCGGPAWWVPDPASLPDESITRRMLTTLAWAVLQDRRVAQQTAAGHGVEVCSLSMPGDGVRDVSEQIRGMGGGLPGIEILHTDRVKLPPRRVTLVTVSGHVNEPLDEPFRGDQMSRAAPAVLPTSINSTTPWKFSWWVDVEDSWRGYRTAALYRIFCSPSPGAHSYLSSAPVATGSAITRSGQGSSWVESHSVNSSCGPGCDSPTPRRSSGISSNAPATRATNPPLGATGDSPPTSGAGSTRFTATGPTTAPARC